MKSLGDSLKSRAGWSTKGREDVPDLSTPPSNHTNSPYSFAPTPVPYFLALPKSTQPSTDMSAFTATLINTLSKGLKSLFVSPSRPHIPFPPFRSVALPPSPRLPFRSSPHPISFASHVFSIAFPRTQPFSFPVPRTSTSRLPTRLLQPFADPSSFPSLRRSRTSSSNLTRRRSSSPRPSPSTRSSSSSDGPGTPTLLPRCVSAPARLTSSPPDLPHWLSSQRCITRRLPRSKRPTSSRPTGRCPASFR